MPVMSRAISGLLLCIRRHAEPGILLNAAQYRFPAGRVCWATKQFIRLNNSTATVYEWLWKCVSVNVLCMVFVGFEWLWKCVSVSVYVWCVWDMSGYESVFLWVFMYGVCGIFRCEDVHASLFMSEGVCMSVCTSVCKSVCKGRASGKLLILYLKALSHVWHSYSHT